MGALPLNDLCELERTSYIIELYISSLAESFHSIHWRCASWHNVLVYWLVGECLGEERFERMADLVQHMLLVLHDRCKRSLSSSNARRVESTSERAIPF